MVRLLDNANDYGRQGSRVPRFDADRIPHYSVNVRRCAAADRFAGRASDVR